MGTAGGQAVKGEAGISSKLKKVVGNMYRQLEFPDELKFKNGEAAHTPGELAVLLREKVELSDEVLTMLGEGTLERWLQSTGWEELAQRVAVLRKEGVSKIKALVELNKMLSQGPVKQTKSTDTPENKQPLSRDTSYQATEPARPPSQLLNRQRLAVKMFWKLEEDKNRREQEIYHQYREEEKAINTRASAEQERVRKALKETKTSWNIIKKKAKELGVDLANQEVKVTLPETEDADQAFSMAIERARKCKQNIDACVGEIDRMRKEEEEKERKRKEMIEYFKPFIIWGTVLVVAALVFIKAGNAYGWGKVLGTLVAIFVCIGLVCGD